MDRQSDQHMAQCRAVKNIWLLFNWQWANGQEYIGWQWRNSMPAGFRRHLVGKTLINVFHYDSAEIRFADKIVIIQTFS